MYQLWRLQARRELTMVVFIISLGIVVLFVVTIAFLAAEPKKDRGALQQVTTFNREWTPITLVIDEEGLASTLPRLRFGINQAISFWNDGLGFTVFMKLGDISEGAVVPVIGLEKTGQALASARLTVGKDGAIKAAFVEIDEGKLYSLKDTEMVRVLCHELGHVLGLDHDESPSSVMYGRASIASYRITDKDKELLTTAYRRTDG